MPNRSADDALFFVSIAEAGSLARAGRALAVTPSTLSRRLSALEARLGVTLVERTTRALRLTEVGRAYLDRARVVVAALDEAEDVARSYGATPRGTLRITAPPVLGALGLAGVLARYAERCPLVQVDVVLSERAVDLAAERFDLALRLGLPATAPGDLVRRVGVSPRVLCASPSYLQRRGAPATTAELARHALVGLGVEDPASAWTFAKGKRTVTVATSPRLRVNSSLLARELCRAGVGLALLPRFLARVDLASGALVDVALDAAPVAADVQLLLAASAARTAKVRAFVELIRELPRDAVEWT